METPYTVCALVLAYVEGELADASRPVGQTLVAVGAATIDDCCTGSLIVAPERIFQTTDPFPTELGFRAGASPCEDAPIGMDVLIRVDRCVPVMDDKGNAPSNAAEEQAYNDLLIDAALVWKAITSTAFLGDDGFGDPVWQRANISQQFIGAEGGCVAVETRVTLGVGQTGWCVTL